MPTSWTNRTKPTTSWGNRTKPSTSWGVREKPTVAWVLNRIKSFLLQENASYILTESGFKIVLSGASEPDWNTRTKPTTSWTIRIKP